MPVKGVEGKSERELQRAQERGGGGRGCDEGAVGRFKIHENERDGSVETMESLNIPKTT